MKYHGSCHCGNIDFEVEGDIESLLECNCSMCSRRGGLLWFVPAEALRFRKQPELATYTFNKHVIKHHFCPTCGIATFGFGVDPKGARTAAINARVLQDVDLSQFKIIHYDGRSA